MPVTLAISRRSLLAGCGMSAVATAAEASQLRLPGPHPDFRHLPFFPGELLQLALREAGWPDAISLLSSQTWPRQVRELRAGFADVAPLSAIDDEYLPFNLRRVEFPIRRGLQGLRRLICRTEDLGNYQDIRNLAALQRLRLGYGVDWADRPIMERLGFRIVPLRGGEPLYTALRQRSADFLSRGVNEYINELAAFGKGNQEIALVPGLALFYPVDDCFFVRAERTDLHEALTKGLNSALRNGQYASLFRRHFGEAIKEVQGVRVLTLDGYPTPPRLPRSAFDVLNLIPGVVRS
jgi:hypothetical protein